MSKTQSLEINCVSANSSANGNRLINVVIDKPDDIDELLGQFHEDDIIQYVAGNMQPDDIFSTTELAKWAESEGYAKE